MSILKKAKQKHRLIAGLASLALSLCLLSILALCVFAVIQVDGISGMEPVIRDRDYVFINRFELFPSAGKIAYISQGKEKPAVLRRVVATGGQTVEINYNENTIYIDGVPFDDPYKTELMLPAGDIHYPFTVPQHEYFVLGDNRNGAIDSRFSYFGTVKQEQIIGAAVFRLYPYGDIAWLS
ncbi:MAG: signal peptidase I [Oscillospiraceae bacterium]|nr:signal peptidase I [Oscillospiraceae bacterium]